MMTMYFILMTDLRNCQFATIMTEDRALKTYAVGD